MQPALLFLSQGCIELDLPCGKLVRAQEGERVGLAGISEGNLWVGGDPCGALEGSSGVERSDGRQLGSVSSEEVAHAGDDGASVGKGEQMRATCEPDKSAHARRRKRKSVEHAPASMWKRRSLDLVKCFAIAATSSAGKHLSASPCVRS